MAADVSPSPLAQALRQAAEREPAVFHTPGHKRGRWTGAQLGLAAPGFFWAWDGGDAVWAPEQGHRLNALVDDAAGRSAALWGASRSWLLWNGATAGVLAMVLAATGPGQVLVLPRDVHRSALAALVLSGARPVFVPSPVMADWDLPLPPTSREVEAALRAAGVATASPARSPAVLTVSPTYYGVIPDLPALVRVASPGPLLVDEAHGSHLAFADGLPCGLGSGACLVVHGTHKTLCAPTQTGLLHMGRPPGQGGLQWPGPERVAACLAMVQSTSPHPLLLAALDELEGVLRREGRPRVQAAADAARLARERIEAVGPFRCLKPQDLPPPWRLDETRLVVDVAACGLTGFDAYRFLVERHNVWPEMADGRRVVFIFTGADEPSSAERLGEAFEALYRERAGRPGPAAREGWAPGRAPLPHVEPRGPAGLPPAGELVLTPREAVLGPSRWVRWEQAAGEVAADAVTPYPPGTPVVVPGERIGGEVARWALAAAAAGAELRGWMGDCSEGLWVVA